MNDVNPFRSLPAVHEVLREPGVQTLMNYYAHEQVVDAIREEVDAVRRRLVAGEALDGLANAAALALRVAHRLGQAFQPRLRSVINATGIVLHTNLGRAPLAEAAARAAYEAGRGYLNLELELEDGKRSSRQNAIRDWVCTLTGAESATAVNNNAAATVIALRSLCAGKEAIVSRGQLIEIGGSFRIPDIMAVSGAILREVGTTNITRLSDYERAIGPVSGALMQIHTSNYRISGFTKSVALADLVALGKKHGLPVIDDIGSGALLDFERFGLMGEPVARDSITAGVDLVLFSGDKLLGGPQAGILAGRKALIESIEHDPLMRAFRLDKMTLAALEATLRLYLQPERALAEVPVLQMLGTPLAELHQRTEALAKQLRALQGLAQVMVGEDRAYVGGGSLPDQAMKTLVVEIAAQEISDAELAYRLRIGNPAVVARVRSERLVLDLRTVFGHQEAALVEAIRSALGSSPRQRHGSAVTDL
jgi:L-seryl-tRNA(Ser) seleniumtransferase